MNARRILRYASTGLLLALTLAVLLPAITGRPVVSYASSSSMEPTIGVLDGFFVNPYPTHVEPGDIIVYDSITRRGPAVHRVVAADGDGWDTQGDANDGLDQQVGEPVVTRDRILGKVLTWPDGSPIVVKRLGATFLEGRAQTVHLQEQLGGPRQLAAAGFLLLALFFAIPALIAGKTRRLPTRMPLRARAVLRRLLPRGVLGRHVGIVLLLVLVFSLTLAAANARQEVVTSMVVLRDPTASDHVRAAGPGGELPRDIQVAALGMIPTVVVLEPGSDAVRSTRESVLLAPHATTIFAVWQRAGDTPGLQEDTLHVWRYPALLPPSLIVAMHDAVPGSPFLALGLGATGIGALWFRALRIATLPVARTLGIREDWL